MLHKNHVKRLPGEHDYLRHLFSDAVWLILSRVEEEESRKQAAIIPRELVIKIRLMPSDNELPILVNEKIIFGKPYGRHYTSMYSSGPYAMALPRMYCDDPSEYWRMHASTMHLISDNKTL